MGSVFPQWQPAEATAAIGQAHEAFKAWRSVPAPRRGELVRLLGEELRAAKADLGRLVTLEAGKMADVVIWNRETIQERWEDYEMGQYLSERWFPFGSDGGDEMLCFDLSCGTDGVFAIPFIGMSDEEAMSKYDSFPDVAAAILKSPRE